MRPFYFNAMVRFGMLLFCITSTLNLNAQLRRMNVKVEPTYGPDFNFPENKYVGNKKNVGVAFSGAGTRAAAATLGQLRALNALGLLDTIKYISSVSGASWSALTFTYLPATENDSSFLGNYIAPQNLTLNDLTETPEGSLAFCIAHAHTFPRSFKHSLLLEGRRKNAGVLNDIYLKRLDLGIRHKYFTYNMESDSDIVSRNIDLKLYDFYTVNPRRNRPFLILNSTFVGGMGNSRGLNNNCFEITPLYSGLPYYNPESKIPAGGGYYESFGINYNRISTIRNNNMAVVKVNHKKQMFSLADAMALSGRTFYASTNRKGFMDYGGYPKIALWSPYQYWNQDYFIRKGTEKFTLADGADFDNLGIIPLLRRKVDRIIVFVNANQPIQISKLDVAIDESIARLFGEFNNYNEVEPAKTAPHILYNDKHQLENLKNKLLELKHANEPLIYTATYEVYNNERYGIYTNATWHSVQITWVYSDNPQPFYAKLKDKEIRNLHRQGKLNQNVGKNYRLNNETGQFPFYVAAWGSNLRKGLDYKNEHVNIMADFSAWVIMDNADYFKKIVLGN
jgi:hypothetical protein